MHSMVLLLFLLLLVQNGKENKFVFSNIILLYDMSLGGMITFINDRHYDEEMENVDDKCVF